MNKIPIILADMEWAYELIDKCFIVLSTMSIIGIILYLLINYKIKKDE